MFGFVEGVPLVSSRFVCSLPDVSKISSSGGTRFVFFLGGGFGGGGIEGAKCDSEGAKIPKFAENGRFRPLVSSDGWGGQVG